MINLDCGGKIIKKAIEEIMKKRITCIVAVIMIVLTMSVLFVACNGKDGKSAYDLAVEQGFEGTLEEWLESLKGVNGQNGLDGKDGFNGKDGADGAIDVESLYKKAVEEGFEGSYMDFLRQCLSLSSDSKAAAGKALLSAVKIRTVNNTKDKWGRPNVTTAGGSGVIYKLNKEVGSAYIITNYHVVYNGTSTNTGGISHEIKVFIFGKEREEDAITARYIGGAYDYDIAILQVKDSDVIKNSEVRAVDVAVSRDALVGSTVMAVGNPSTGGILESFEDFKISVTQGVLCVDSEYIMVADDSGYSIYVRAMRVDAAINAGNSGGGLYNQDGELIGIVNAKSNSKKIENVGYAIPIDVVAGIADYAIAYCNGATVRKVSKCSLGVTTKILSSKAVYDSDLQATRLVETIAVSAFDDDSLVKDLLNVDDVIDSIEIDGKVYVIDREFALDNALWNVKLNDRQSAEIKLNITRDGNKMEIPVTVTASSFKELK